MKNKYKFNNSVYEGKVFHSRKKPKKHSFRYHVFYLHLNLNNIKKKKYKLLSFNKFNLFSFYEKDHGPKGCENLEKWIKELLKKNNIIININQVYLLTLPRILGYVFNPLSIYSCFDKKGNLIVQIYEVHNTFNQRYFYIVENTFEEKNYENIYNKRFHVSPFMSMKGSYKFKSIIKKDKIYLLIKYSSKKENFMASFSGKKQSLTDMRLLKYFFKIPMMTIKIIVGIHYEAIILYLKGVRYYKCPKPSNINFIKYFRKDKCG